MTDPITKDPSSEANSMNYPHQSAISVHFRQSRGRIVHLTFGKLRCEFFQPWMLQGRPSKPESNSTTWLPFLTYSIASTVGSKLSRKLMLLMLDGKGARSLCFNRNVPIDCVHLNAIFEALIKTRQESFKRKTPLEWTWSQSVWSRSLLRLGKRCRPMISVLVACWILSWLFPRNNVWPSGLMNHGLLGLERAFANVGLLRIRKYSKENMSENRC